MRGVSGFTLMEMVVALLLVTLLTPLVFSAITSLSAAQEQAYRATIRRDHERIASALLAYARQETPLGTFPAPYSGGAAHSALLDPANTALAQHLRATGLNTVLVNHDGSASANVRVYQRVSGLTANVPVFFQSGPLATLTYDFAAIHQTACPQASPCNGGLPGDSPALTAANHTAWTVTGSDFLPVFVSTLPQQKRMLAETLRRIGGLRRALAEFAQAGRLAAAAGDPTNHYPSPNGAGAPHLSGANPVTNEGCHDGWYDLAAGNVNVIQQVGLARGEFAVTAWGGAIAYCRDYDPAASDGSTADQPPHAAALRLYRALSLGSAPGAPGSNLLFPI
ncbi:hypothetical protein [Endothiovibrio diazotrophicus]